MKSLLRSYFYRLFHSAGFYIQMGVLFGLGLIVALIMMAVGYYDDPMVNKATFAFLGWTGSGVINGLPWIPLTIFAFAGAINYHREVTSGALRNYIVSGHSRTQIYLGLYIGNLTYYLFLQVATFLGLGTLGIICAAAPGEGFEPGAFATCFILSTFADIALVTFFYALFSVMKGHGFSGPLGVIIYTGLSMAATIVTLVLASMFRMQNLSADVLKGYLTASVWIYPVLRDTMAAGSLSAAPSAELVKMLSGGLEPVDNTAMNLAAGIILPTLLGAGSFVLGLLKFRKDDFK